MSDPNTQPELKKTLVEVLEQTTSGFSTHPDPDRLFAYNSGQLSAQEEEELQEHLSLCRECLDRLYIDPEDPTMERREGVEDLNARRAWREAEAHIRENRARRDLERQRRRTRLYQIAAAVFLVLGAGMAFLPFFSQEQSQNITTVSSTGPVVNAGVFDCVEAF